MRFAVILHAIGWICAVMALAMLVPAVFAVAADGTAAAQSILAPVAVVGFIAGGLILGFRGRPVVPTRRDSLLLLVLVWFVAPLAGALPFYVSGHPGGIADSVFESVSGFTTTGATVFADLAGVPSGILVWRGLLQWMGGLATLLAIAAVLGPLAGIDIIDRHLGLMRSGAPASGSHLFDTARRIAPLYSGLTAACFVGLVIAGIPPFDAFCLAMSAVSTGGFMPRTGTLADYGAPFAEPVLAVFMVLGAVSIVWVAALLERRWSVLRELREPVWLIWLVFAAAIVVLVAAAAAPGQGQDQALPRTILTALAVAASLVSTTGFAISSDMQAALPYLFLLFLAFIGGGRFSTAGGLKLFRAVAMLRQLGREFHLLLYPHGVRAARYADEERDAQVMKYVWTAFVAAVTVLAALTIVLTATGLSFTGSLIAAVGSLSNVGPVYDFARHDQLADAPTYAAMGTAAKLALCAGMIAGRLEIIAVISVLSISYWRH